MGFNCGIVGLPNVGKSTIFNALTRAQVEASNFPFCTIDPNTGIVPVRDPRLDQLAAISGSEKVVPTAMEFVDIAGLVKGASQGEGLGNKFLANIRDVDAIAEVVRCFDDPDVVHVHGTIDPAADADVVQTELLLSDLETVDRRLTKVTKMTRVGNKDSAAERTVLEQLRDGLQSALPARAIPLTPEEAIIARQFQLLTAKPMLYVANVDESTIANPEQSSHLRAVQARADREGTLVVPICGKIEAEIAQLDTADRATFLADLGMKESGLDALARAGHRLLRMICYFTTGPKETRAWTITDGMKAPQAAGKIHSDMERGFIRAEVYHCEDLFAHRSEGALRAKGLIRQEGKDYVVKDGDVMFIKFNV